MIKEHVCLGSSTTSYHTFNFTVNGMDFVISEGAYYIHGNPVISSSTETRIHIPVSPKNMEYNIYLTSNGIVVIVKNLSDYQCIKIDNLIDKIAWFTVPSNVNDLNDVAVNVVSVNLLEEGVEDDGSEVPK